MKLDQYPPDVQGIAELVVEELQRARTKHAPMASAHEGYAIILEELDELWDEVRKHSPNRLRLAEEAIQVAAMAMRFLLDVARDSDAQ